MTTEPRTDAAALSIEGLAFDYPDGTAALHGIDLKVMDGERVAVLGPNGAGKSTLSFHLNGIHEIQRGSVQVHGVPVGPDTVGEVRRRVQLLFPNPDDQLFMSSVEEDVAFGPANLGLSGDELAARVLEAMTAVDITELAHRPPHHLSTGEKRRAALAAVLAMRPDILVLDEPTAGLDPRSRRSLFHVLDGLQQTLLVITHNLPFALQLCPRTVILDAGRIVADGVTREILCDDALLRRHQLALPFGFDPTATS